MIDELADRLADWICEKAPQYFKPRWIRAANNGIIWRIRLYIGSMIRFFMAIIRHEEKEQAEQDTLTLQNILERLRLAFARADAFCRRAELPALLFCAAYAVLCALATGQSWCALGAVLVWIARTLVLADPDGNFRFEKYGQVHLMSVFLRSVGLLVMIPAFLRVYGRQIIETNVLLQGMIAAGVCVHLVLFFVLILPGCRRNRLLGALSCVMGLGTAMLPAAACAAAASMLAAGPVVFAGSIIAAVGAVSAFLGERMLDIIEIGGCRLRLPSLWRVLLFAGGWILMTAGLWAVG